MGLIMVSISKKFKFIYIAAPKTASTSITNCLKRYTDEPDFFHHATTLETKTFLKEKNLDWNDFYSFSTVRNPWARLVSAYNHAQVEGTETELWREHLKDMKETLSVNMYYKKLVDRAEEQMHPIIKRPWKQYLVDFKIWIRKFSNMEQYHYEYMYCDENGKCPINQFIKVEELDKEFPN